MWFVTHLNVGRFGGRVCWSKTVKIMCETQHLQLSCFICTDLKATLDAYPCGDQYCVQTQYNKICYFLVRVIFKRLMISKWSLSLWIARKTSDESENQELAISPYHTQNRLLLVELRKQTPKIEYNTIASELHYLSISIPAVKSKALTLNMMRAKPRAKASSL